MCRAGSDAVIWSAGRSNRWGRVERRSRWAVPREGGCGAARAVLLILAGMLASQAIAGEKIYGPGVSDTEIRIGNTSPYSGPASAFSMVAKTEEAYFRKVNAEGVSTGAASFSCPMMTPIHHRRRSNRRGA